VSTLVIKIKQGMPSAQQGLSQSYKSELSDMLREIQALPISDEAKASARAQIGQELKARFSKG